MTFSEWLARELSAAKVAVDDIPSANRKGLRVALFRLRAREAESAMRFYDEYEICCRQQDAQDTATDHVSQ